MRIDGWHRAHRPAWGLTLLRLRLLVLGVLALSVLLAPAHLTVAQQAATVRLAPVAGSGVSGMVTIATRERAVTVTVAVSGLAPGANHLVRLHAGSCTQPSAGFGQLGTLVADSDGRATLTTEHATASAGGVSIDLTLDLLADSAHSILVQGPARPVACSEISGLAAPASPGLPRTGASEPDVPSRLPPGALLGLGLLLVGLGLGNLIGAAALRTRR
jgi:hypothetical protein